MLRNYYINKSWMLSAAAQRVYRAAASIALALFFLIIVLLIAGTPASLRPLLRLLVLAGVFGTALTAVAMEYFLFGFDESSAWRKTFWFAVMMFPPLGPSLYCFLVYSRSDVVKRAHPQRAEGKLAI